MIMAAIDRDVKADTAAVAVADSVFVAVRLLT